MNKSIRSKCGRKWYPSKIAFFSLKQPVWSRLQGVKTLEIIAIYRVGGGGEGGDTTFKQLLFFLLYKGIPMIIWNLQTSENYYRPWFYDHYDLLIPFWVPGTILGTLYTYLHLILTANPIHSRFIDETSKAQRHTCLCSILWTWNENKVEKHKWQSISVFWINVWLI